MAKPSTHQTRAQKHFTASERRDETFKEQMERERSARDAKNVKLRALRLAKESADKEAADKLAAENVGKKKAPRARKKALV